MPRRPIAPRESLPGTKIEIEDGDRKYTLFLPDAGRPSKDVELTLHFHSAQWHAIQEHLDRGATGPIVAFYPGEGSSIYGKSFEDRQRLDRWKDRVLRELKERGWPQDAQISAIDITSFSAGYGAVRQLVQQPAAFKLMRRVILADSMYGSLAVEPDPAAAPPKLPLEPRAPLAAHVLVWKPLAEAAIKGEKTFCVTFSAVPTPTYASSSEMANALVEAVGGHLEAVEPGKLPATEDPEFPLRTRFDQGRFHVWGYGGEDGQAHMTHARHLADIWKALDRAEARKE